MLASELPAQSDLSAARQLTARIDPLEAAGRYGEAVPLAEKALALYEGSLGPEHPETITARGLLAVLHLSSADAVTADVIAHVDELLLRNFTIHQKSPTGDPGATRGLLTGRAFLLPGQGVPQGYGLYSFLLFDAPARGQQERALHLKALEAYLLVLPAMTELEQHRRQSELNVTLVPLKTDLKLPANLTRPGEATRAAEQILAVYDYARARTVLDGLGMETRRSGPYFLSTVPGVATQRLFVDMSHVVPDLVWDWTRTFCWLAAQERSWSDVALQKLELNTRNAFALAATRFFEIIALPQSVRLVNTSTR